MLNSVKCVKHGLITEAFLNIPGHIPYLAIYHTLTIPGHILILFLHCFNGTISGFTFYVNVCYWSMRMHAITGIDQKGKVNRRGDTSLRVMLEEHNKTVLTFLRAYLGTQHPFDTL